MEPTTNEILDAKLDEIKAMLIEILEWKSEMEATLTAVSQGGLLSAFSKMFSNNG